MTSRRVQVRGGRFAPVVPEGAVWIGRPAPYLAGSVFANRHPVGRVCAGCGLVHERVGAVAAYARDLDAAPELVERARRDLVDVDLACRCSLDPAQGPCHGDVLALVVGGVDPLAADLAGAYGRAGRGDLADRVVDMSRAVAGLAEPAAPVDGDCLIWPQRVRDLLRGAGYAAEEATAVGCIGAERTTIVFVHTVTLTGDIVIDLTARQFRPSLPRRWFAGIGEYCAGLAGATGCSVSLGPVAGLG